MPLEYFCTGIGNYETIFSLSTFLTERSDASDFFIINIGICGYWNQTGEKPEKLIQIGRIKNCSTQKEALPLIPFLFSKIESIWSSETPLLETIDEEGYVDMESRGIQLICERRKVPLLMLKVPFDRVGMETLAFDREKACNRLAENIDYEQLMAQCLEIFIS